MSLSTTVVCLNTSKHRLYKRFHGTSMPKLTTGYDVAAVGAIIA